MDEGKSCAGLPFLLDFRLVAREDAGVRDDSSAGWDDDGPGWDIAGRFREPRRGTAAAVAAGGAGGAGATVVRCLFALRVAGAELVRSGGSKERSGRTGALRFRVDCDDAVGVDWLAPEPADGGVSAASLAAERVILNDGAAVLETPVDEEGVA